MPEVHIKNLANLARLFLDMLCGALEGKKDTVEGCVECCRAVAMNEITSGIDHLRLQLLDAEEELASLELELEESNGAMTWEEETCIRRKIEKINEAIEWINEAIKIEERNEVKNDDTLVRLLEFWKNLLDARDKETLRESTKCLFLQLIFLDSTLGEDQKDAAKKEVEENVDKLFHEFGDKVAGLMAVVKQIRVLSEA